MIKVGWGNTKQEYLIWQFQEDWHMKDYRQAFNKTADLLASQGISPILVDMRLVGSKNLLAMAYESLQYKTFLTNRVIFVGTLTLLRPIYTMLCNLLAQKGIRVSLVETMDEAYQIIIQEKTSRV